MLSSCRHFLSSILAELRRMSLPSWMSDGLALIVPFADQSALSGLAHCLVIGPEDSNAIKCIDVKCVKGESFKSCETLFAWSIGCNVTHASYFYFSALSSCVHNLLYFLSLIFLSISLFRKHLHKPSPEFEGFEAAHGENRQFQG